MKTYEILIKAYTSVVVKAESADDALEIAADEISMGKFELDEMAVEKELKTEEEIEAAVRHSEYHRMDFQKTPYEAYE